MTGIKLCGLTRICDITYANALMPEYIGFVFARKSRRYVTPEKAELLRKQLNWGIIPVGVFVDAPIDQIVELLNRHIIEAVQLHGHEEEAYIRELRRKTNCMIIQAFQIQKAEEDSVVKEQQIRRACQSSADYVLLDSGGGSGKIFDWSLLSGIQRPYFLAGGLTPENVGAAIELLQPFAVDVSSSLEMDGVKDRAKMETFVKAVRGSRVEGKSL